MKYRVGSDIMCAIDLRAGRKEKLAAETTVALRHTLVLADMSPE